MKKETNYKPRKSENLQRLDNLMSAAVKRYEVEEIMASLLEHLTYRDADICSEMLLKNDKLEDDIREKVRNEDKLNYFMVKVETAKHKEQLEEFVMNNIYTSYNEQQHYLFN